MSTKRPYKSFSDSELDVAFNYTCQQYKRMKEEKKIRKQQYTTSFIKKYFENLDYSDDVKHWINGWDGAVFVIERDDEAGLGWKFELQVCEGISLRRGFVSIFDSHSDSSAHYLEFYGKYNDACTFVNANEILENLNIKSIVDWSTFRKIIEHLLKAMDEYLTNEMDKETREENDIVAYEETVLNFI